MINYILKVNVVMFLASLLSLHSYAQVSIFSTSVCFTDTTLLQNISTISGTQSAYWDLDNDGFFDDAMGNYIQHIFTTSGNNQVRLQIIDSSGITYYSSAPHIVTVYALPKTLFTAEGLCFGQTTLFSNQSSVNDLTPLTYTWDFTNDGITDNISINPSFQYLSTGTFTVKLTSQTSQNCSSFLTKTIVVTQPPTSNFTAQNTCVNSPVTFINQSVITGSISAQLIWNFGNDFLDFNQDTVTHIYTNSGNFTVQLKIIDITGCADSTSQTIVVDSIVNYTLGLSNGTQFYQGQSTQATVSGDFTSINWADTSTLATRTFTNAGTYSFTITNAVGCTAVDRFTIITIAAPALEPANDFLTPNADGKNDVLFFQNIDAFSDCKLKVYDQRGLSVFTSDEYKNNWNGENNNAGVYFYFLTCSQVPEIKGLTNLIK